MERVGETEEDSDGECRTFYEGWEKTACVYLHFFNLWNKTIIKVNVKHKTPAAEIWNIECLSLPFPGHG